MRALSLFILVSCVSLSAAAEAPIVRGVIAKRVDGGGVVISGDTSLPDETRLMVEVRKSHYVAAAGGQSDPIIVSGGRFQTPPFTNGTSPISAGSYKVLVTAFFNEAWGQPPAVIAFAGKDGSELSVGTQVQPDDKEFPRAARHLAASFAVVVPDVASDTDAIQKVQSARLLVKGSGRSSETVLAGLDFFEKAGGFKPLGWSAVRTGARWVVTLDYLDGGNAAKATWEYVPASHAVTYLDPNAKTLSYIPAD